MHAVVMLSRLAAVAHHAQTGCPQPPTFARRSRATWLCRLRSTCLLLQCTLALCWNKALLSVAVVHTARITYPLSLPAVQTARHLDTHTATHTLPRLAYILHTDCSILAATQTKTHQEAHISHRKARRRLLYGCLHTRRTRHTHVGHHTPRHGYTVGC